MLLFDNGTVSWDDLNVLPTYNESGDIEETEKHEVSVRCNISTISDSRKDYEDGQSQQATYCVTIDMNSVPSVIESGNGKLTASYIKLRHDRKGYLGTFPIQQVEYYEITQSIAIWV